MSFSGTSLKMTAMSSGMAKYIILKLIKYTVSEKNTGPDRTGPYIFQFFGENTGPYIFHTVRSSRPDRTKIYGPVRSGTVDKYVLQYIYCYNAV